MAPNDAQLRLQEAVENAYRIFAPYRPGVTLATCRCPQCMDKETERLLLTTPLRKIDQRLLSEYTWSANGTNNPSYSPEELRYFLPRYFEFIAAGVYPCFGDPEPTLRQLRDLQFRSHWALDEVGAVDDFLAAIVETRVSRLPEWYTDEQCRSRVATDDIESVLCLAVHAGGDLKCLLDVWERTAGEAATIHLAALAIEAKSILELGLDFPGPFWGDFEFEAAALKSWVFRLETAERLAVAEGLAVEEPILNLMKEAQIALRSS